MSLLSAGAIHIWPALQSRTFLAFSVIATSGVEDNFVAHMVACLRDALLQTRDLENGSVLTLIRAFANMVPSLQVNSIYLPQLFWIAVGLVAFMSNHQWL